MRYFVPLVGIFSLLSAACGGNSEPLTRERGLIFATPTQLTAGAALQASCDSAARWVSTGAGTGGLAIGPIVLHIAPDALSHDGRIRAMWSPTRNALLQKLPISISAPMGTQVRLHAVALDAGRSMLFEYPNETAGGVPGEPAAEPAFDVPGINRSPDGVSFIPGAMQFSAEGCYHVFVSVAGNEYGPFGFEVVRGGF